MKKIHSISFSFFCILFLATNFNLYAQEEALSADSLDTPEIVYLKAIVKDTSYQADIIQFDEHIAYIFQKEYGDVFYKNDIKKGFLQSGLDLDLPLIKEIDSLLTEENIIEADKKFMQFQYQEMYAMPNAYSRAEVEIWEKEGRENFEKDRDKRIREQRYAKLDRQYFGYINNRGEKIVKIFLIDFGDDPFNSKKLVNQRIVPLFTNGIYPRVKILHYNLSTRKLTVNEDV